MTNADEIVEVDFKERGNNPPAIFHQSNLIFKFELIFPNKQPRIQLVSKFEL